MYIQLPLGRDRDASKTPDLVILLLDLLDCVNTMSASIAELFGVKGRVALVTGGTSGVGMMIARGLVSNGVKTYVTGLASDDIKSSVAELNELAMESGGQAIGCAVSSVRLSMPLDT